MSEILTGELPGKYHPYLTYQSGPSFAREVGLGKPANVTVAGESGSVRKRVQEWMGGSSFRILHVRGRGRGSGGRRRQERDERDHAKLAKANLIWMANHATRVEVTIMTRDGQWKGHAIVVDSNKADVWLIEGQVKKDIYMTTDDVFVGLNVVHTSKLFLDQQSFTNLDVNGFFRTDPAQPGNRLVRWMREYLQSYITAFEKGEYVEKIVDHLDEAKYREDTEKFLGFWLYDVVARGGDPKWFAHWTKAFLRQALQHVNARMNGRISLPIPGLNLYVFPASAVHMSVKRGHCVIDRERCTIWVNDVDLFTLDPSFGNVYELQAWLDRHDATR